MCFSAVWQVRMGKCHFFSNKCTFCYTDASIESLDVYNGSIDVVTPIGASSPALTCRQASENTVIKLQLHEKSSFFEVLHWHYARSSAAVGSTRKAMHSACIASTFTLLNKLCLLVAGRTHCTVAHCHCCKSRRHDFLDRFPHGFFSRGLSFERKDGRIENTRL